jgi:hypothetical protein
LPEVQILSALNLSNTTSKLRTGAMFVIVHLHMIFHAQYVDKFVFCLCTKFRMPSSNGLLITAIKPKDNQHFPMAITLLF